MPAKYKDTIKRGRASSTLSARISSSQLTISSRKVVPDITDLLATSQREHIAVVKLQFIALCWKATRMIFDVKNGAMSTPNFRFRRLLRKNYSPFAAFDIWKTLLVPVGWSRKQS